MTFHVEHFGPPRAGFFLVVDFDEMFRQKSGPAQVDRLPGP